MCVVVVDRASRYNRVKKTQLDAQLQAETICIRKEDIEKDIRSNTEGKWRVETQNKRGAGKHNQT
jgi:hypothetical protein